MALAAPGPRVTKHTPGSPYTWVGYYLPSPCHADASWTGERDTLITMGWGLAAAGLAYLLNSFALLLAPAFAKLLFPAVMLPVLVGELAFALWLALSGRQRL